MRIEEISSAPPSAASQRRRFPSPFWGWIFPPRCGIIFASPGTKIHTQGDPVQWSGSCLSATAADKYKQNSFNLSCFIYYFVNFLIDLFDFKDCKNALTPPVHQTRLIWCFYTNSIQKSSWFKKQPIKRTRSLPHWQAPGSFLSIWGKERIYDSFWKIFPKSGIKTIAFPMKA